VGVQRPQYFVDGMEKNAACVRQLRGGPLGEADEVIYKDVECAEGPAAREQWVAFKV